jgi:hypothetical protein
MCADSVAQAEPGFGDEVALVALRAAVAGELVDGYVDTNPCADHLPFTRLGYRWTGNFRVGEVEFEYIAESTISAEVQDSSWYVPGASHDVMYEQIDLAEFRTTTVTAKEYAVACEHPQTSVRDEGTLSFVWIPVVTEEVLIPDVMAELVTLIPAPNVYFPVADPTYGWLYVKTPMEIRVDNLEPVTASVTATNAISSATATATAEPSRVIFEPGEPYGPATVCSVESVEMGWDRDDPDGSGCVYSYINSSAIVPPEHKFQTRTRAEWHVTGTGGLDMTLQTTAYDYVAVAEVQAVVVDR